MIYDVVTLDDIKKVQKKVTAHSKSIEEVVMQIIRPYSKDLDKYVEFIRNCLSDGENSPTDAELEDYCMNLATYIYFAGGMVEQLGIKDDVSKAIYKEMYHSSRNDLDKGTVADKDSLAELSSQTEFLTNVCYHRAWQIMKSKVENAQELLSSIKKVLTRRMNEYQLTHMVNN